MSSHPHPQPLSQPLLLLKRPLPLFLHPPQKKSKRIIQIQELHPLLEEVDVPHPHPVAVKSLIIFCLQKDICFMVYHMYHGLYVFPKKEKSFLQHIDKILE